MIKRVKLSTYFFVVSALPLALSFGACSGLGIEGGEPIRQVTSTALPPLENVKETAPQVPAQVARSVGRAYTSPQLEKKISFIIARLRKFSDRPNINFNAVILNSSTPNAFALPDGQLFITRGLLALMNDEAELAAVLAHEMAHVEARHANERLMQAKNAQLANQVLSKVTGNAQQSKSHIAAAALALAQFSRQQETEADGIGIRLIARAGYDPYGAARMLETMGRYAALQQIKKGQVNDEGEGSFYNSHPSNPSRIAAAVSTARQYAAQGVGYADRNSFLVSLDGLIYGDDPEQGLVRGNIFSHAKLGFMFQAPQGFYLENSSAAISGVSREGQALRFEKLNISASTPLEAIIQQSATPDMTLSALETLPLNGAEAVTAQGVTSGQNSWVFRFVVIKYNRAVYRFIFVSKKYDAQVDASFKAAAQTFRKLEADDLQAFKPRQLRIVMLDAGTTATELSQKMAIEEPKLESFLVLNGIDQQTPLKLGTAFKVVTEN